MIRAGLIGQLRQRPIEPDGEPFETDWLCGALLIGRTAQLQEMTGFDSNIFLYFEETDLCKRMIDRGSELWAVGRAVVVHDANASARQTGQSVHMGNRSRRRPSTRHTFAEHGDPMSIGDAPGIGVRAFGAASNRRRWFVVATIAVVVALPFVGAAISALL